MRTTAHLAAWGSAILASMLGASTASAAGVESSAGATVVDVGVTSCSVPLPMAFALPGVGDDVTIDAVVLLDGVSTPLGKAVMAEAAKAYADLGVRLRVVQWVEDEDVNFSSHEAPALLAEARSLTGGVPPQADVVHVLTSKDIFKVAAGGRNQAVAGDADCVGGVRDPSRAFSVSEVRNFGFENGAENGRVAALVAAHEIGHLLGGHHHYANCVEGVVRVSGSGATVDPGAASEPCTVMFDVLNPTSLGFSTLNGSAVRGHAIKWAND